MARRTGSSRQEALRRAREALAQQQSEREKRAKMTSDALMELVNVIEKSSEERAKAEERARHQIELGDQRAAEFDEIAGDAIRRLRDLDQTNADIAKLSGLTVSEIRSLANRSGTERPARLNMQADPDLAALGVPEKATVPTAAGGEGA